MVSFPPITVRQPRRTTSSTTPCGYAASARGSRASSPRTREGRQPHPMANTCTNEVRVGPVGGSNDGDHPRETTGSRNRKGQALP
jgi:hypothetical protein